MPYVNQGAPRDQLEAGLKSIRAVAPEWSMEVKRVVRGQVSGTKGSLSASIACVPTYGMRLPAENRVISQGCM